MSLVLSILVPLNWHHKFLTLIKQRSAKPRTISLFFHYQSSFVIKTPWLVHKTRSASFSVTSQLLKKNKNTWPNIFGCPTYPNHYPPHLTLPHSFSWPAISLPLICFLFFSFHLNKHTHFSPLHSPTSLTLSHRCHSIPPSPPYFLGKITGKSLGTSKHLYPFYLR